MMLKQRILSACVLLPLPVLALYFGSPWFELLCAVILAVMGWEWEKLILNRFSVLGMLIAVTGI
ncbi:MAG: phosphatidate cytidylyltransferase [Alphaproteobacteria bacterium]|nr:phosphatidate cytidylyltransferase [Alphaproteobacteria bacterium]